MILHASLSRPVNIALDVNRGMPLSRQLESLGDRGDQRLSLDGAWPHRDFRADSRSTGDTRQAAAPQDSVVPVDTIHDRDWSWADG